MSSRKGYNKEYYLRNREKLLKASKDYRLANLDKIKERSARYYREHREETLTRQQEYNKTHRDQHKRIARKCHLKMTYGLTPECYEEILDKQGRACAICKTTEPGGRFKEWSVDHDHACCAGRKSCGKCIRGLLCSACNQALGLFGDRLDVLKEAVTYLNSNFHPLSEREIEHL
jgi:Recombination endonuclease VII